MIEFNPNSGAHLSALLFGGSFLIDYYEPILSESGVPKLYKSGTHQNEIKLKKVLGRQEIQGLGVKPLPEWKTKKEGVYQTNEKVLEEISSWFRNDQEAVDLGIVHENGFVAKQIVELILEIRRLKKQISTYFDSTLECMDENDFVHAQFNHTATDTGRLSCNKPNIQNQPDRGSSKVKQHFISRYGANGMLLQADYSQIEPCTHAQLSGDPALISDVVNQVDTYCKYMAVNSNLSYDEIVQKAKIDFDEEWVAKRAQAKTVVLADRYGAGVNKLMQQSGLSQQEVESLKDATRKLYPRYTIYNSYLKEQVNKTGQYIGFTGRLYKFKKYPPKFNWQKIDSYNPNEIKNYMYQGTAFDIYSLTLGKFWREKVLLKRDKYLLINTIHDSVMLDCKKEYLEEAKKDLKTLDRLPILCYNIFNYHWTVPIKIDISEGETWYDL